jgi:hypothetical protein
MRLLTLVAAALPLATGAFGQTRPAAHYDVDRTPFVEIGGDGTGTDPVLTAVFSATRTTQGFVVGEAQSLLFVDPKGKLLRTVGRQGQGPGEFMGGIFINQCAADSLFVWDSRTNRVSVFTASGSFVRQIPAFATRVTCSRAGVIAMLLRPSAPAPGRGSTGGMMSSIRLLNLAGNSVGGVGQVPWGENRLFGASTSIALRGSQLYVGTGREPAIDVYDRGGRLLRRITFPHRPVRVSTSAHERAVEGLLAVMKRSGNPNIAQQRATLLAQPVPEVFPPYREIAVAANGVIWLLTTQLSDSVAHLKGVRDDGSVVSEADLPIGDDVRLLEVGDDYVLLTYVTYEGIMKVGAFRLRPRSVER